MSLWMGTNGTLIGQQAVWLDAAPPVTLKLRYDNVPLTRSGYESLSRRTAATSFTGMPIIGMGHLLRWHIRIITHSIAVGGVFLVYSFSGPIWRKEQESGFWFREVHMHTYIIKE